MQKIMMSMHPQFWELMKIGAKKIEFRTTSPKFGTGYKGRPYEPFTVIVCVTGGVGVVGEFICDGIRTIDTIDVCKEVARLGCVTTEQIFAYMQYGKRKVYGWNVSDVKTYDKSKKIEDFGLKRPPQTWQYIKEAK